MIANKSALLSKPPEPPPNLRKDAQAFWRATVSEYELPPTDLTTLELACRQLDRSAAAGRNVRKRGLLVEDRFGILVENPAVAIERQAMNSFRLLVRELALNAAPPDNRPAFMGRSYR